MSDCIINIRIGKLHIQLHVDDRWTFTINNYHRWFGWPPIAVYEFDMEYLVNIFTSKNVSDL